MLRTRRVPLVAALVAALALSACGDSTDTATSTTPPVSTTAAGAVTTTQGAGPSTTAATAFPLTIDNCGTKVTFTERPKAVFTSGTTPVNLIASVGAASTIVGRSGEFGQKLSPGIAEAVASVKIATPDRPSAEIVINSGATLFFSDPPNITNLRPQLEAAGIKVLSTCNYGTFEEMWTLLGNLGKLTGNEAKTTGVVKGLQDRLEAVKKLRPGRDRRAAVVSVFQNTLYADGKATLKHSMLGVLGLTNVFAEQDKQTFEVNVEKLISANPDVIVLAYGTDNETFEVARGILLKAPGIEQVAAVRNNAIVGIPFTLSFGSPPALDGLQGLADGLVKLG